RGDPVDRGWVAAAGRRAELRGRRRLDRRSRRCVVAVVAPDARARLAAGAACVGAERAMSARSRSGSAREHGFVAIEWVAAVALLLLPVVVLVATLPEWA